MDSLKGADFEIVFEKTLTYAKAREYFCLIKNLHSLNNQNYNQTIFVETFPFCENSSYSEQYFAYGETELEAFDTDQRSVKNETLLDKALCFARLVKVSLM